MFKRILILTLVFCASMAYSGGQVGNGGFAYYGQHDKIIGAVTGIITKAKKKVAKKLLAADSDIFAAMPKKVNPAEMAQMIRKTYLFAYAVGMRQDPNGDMDIVMMDYQEQKGEKQLFILAPMVIALFYMDEAKAPGFIERAMLLESLHFYGYNQDEAMEWSDYLHKKLFEE